jgi:hypothetical protein
MQFLPATQTCQLECFDHGDCYEQPAVCTCSTWWDGPNCTSLYKGDYVLMIVGSFLVLLFGIYLIVKIVRFSRKKDHSYDTDSYNSEGENLYISDTSPSLSRVSSRINTRASGERRSLLSADSLKNH